MLRSFGYAVEGVSVMLRTQPNFLVHLTAAIVVILLGVTLGLGALEMALIVLTVSLVLVLECLNTALESVCRPGLPGLSPAREACQGRVCRGGADQRRRGGRHCGAPVAPHVLAIVRR